MRHAAPATCCPPNGRPSRAWRASPAIWPRATATREIDTPLFEESEVFERGVGAVTDVVEKELFRVAATRGEEGERWALRPEATAGIVRAYVQHGMQALPQPVRLSLVGPMFRYDRPQAGRYREFWQWDVEAIGDPGPAVDAELIELGLRFYATSGLTGVDVHLNSIGDGACRPAYLERLRAYFEAHADGPRAGRGGAAEGQPAATPRFEGPRPGGPHRRRPAPGRPPVRGVRRPPRIGAGPPGRRLASSRTWSRRSCGASTTTRAPRSSSTASGATGQQQALGGGGRYDGLVELLGGRPTPGIGFALGLDRVVLALAEQGQAAASAVGPTAIVVGADAEDTATRLRLATDLRAAGLAVRADLAPRKLGRQLEGAARDGAHFAVIVGDELAHGQVQVRDLQAGTQRSANVADLARDLSRGQAGHRHG